MCPSIEAGPIHHCKSVPFEYRRQTHACAPLHSLEWRTHCRTTAPESLPVRSYATTSCPCIGQSQTEHSSFAVWMIQSNPKRKVEMRLGVSVCQNHPLYRQPEQANSLSVRAKGWVGSERRGQTTWHAQTVKARTRGGKTDALVCDPPPDTHMPRTHTHAQRICLPWLPI